MKKILLLLFLAFGVLSAPAQQLVKDPTFQGSAKSDLDLGGHAIHGATISKDQVGLSNVENTAISTWPGSSAITNLGTITSGTWHGSTIDLGHIAWPTSISLPSYILNDASGQTSVGWNNRTLYTLHLGSDGTWYNEPVVTWNNNSSFLYSWDSQPLDVYGDDGTVNNGGVKYASQVNPLLNLQSGDTYGWVYYPWGGGRYTNANGNLLNSELYSVQNLWGDGDEQYKSINWSRRLLFDSTSTMGHVQWDDPLAMESVSLDWDGRTLNSRITYNTTVYWWYDPDTPQDYMAWTSTPVASWQGGLHPTFQNFGGSTPIGMRLGMTYANGGTTLASFVLPKTAATGAIFTIVDTKGGGFKVAQQSVGTSSYPGEVVIRMGSNVTTAGASGYITCAPYSTISLMAVDGYFQGYPYDQDYSGGWSSTRTWIVISYSLGTPTFN